HREVGGRVVVSHRSHSSFGHPPAVAMLAGAPIPDLMPPMRSVCKLENWLQFTTAAPVRRTSLADIACSLAARPAGEDPRARLGLGVRTTTCRNDLMGGYDLDQGRPRKRAKRGGGDVIPSL